MSARQAFIPQTPSRAPPTEPHPHSTDPRTKDGDRDLMNGNGKARSLVALLGQKRGNTADGAPQGPGLRRSNSIASKRSFEGIIRPEITPISIIPYPTMGAKQPGPGQTPRKIAGPGCFEFPRPMTPMSVPRGLKKGLGAFVDIQENDANLNSNMRGSGNLFPGPGGGTNACVDAGEYMRRFGGGESAGGVQPSLEYDVDTPMSGYVLGGDRCDADSIYGRSSRSLDAMSETEVGMPRNSNPQGNLVGAKRGVHHEDMDDTGRYTNEGHQPQNSSKRLKQVQPQDPDDYYPISSPQIPPTPGLPTMTADVPEPSTIACALFDNLEEYVSMEEIEAEWKKWRECSTEEWLKGADGLTQEFADIINTVKDRLTEKVMTYAKMISSIEEKRAEVNRNIELIQGRGNTVRASISKLGADN